MSVLGTQANNLKTVVTTVIRVLPNTDGRLTVLFNTFPTEPRPPSPGEKERQTEQSLCGKKNPNKKHFHSHSVMVGITRLYLQGLEEAKGAQTSTSRHQTEGGVVEELLVIKPSKERKVFSISL